VTKKASFFGSSPDRLIISSAFRTAIEHQKGYSDRKPERGLQPILSLQCLKQADTEEKNKNSKTALQD
jgi:hypothetical protein